MASDITIDLATLRFDGKRFENGFRLQFYRLEPGSAIIPLQRVRVDDQSELDWGNLYEFDAAADLIDAAIAAANDDQILPNTLPS